MPCVQAHAHSPLTYPTLTHAHTDTRRVAVVTGGNRGIGYEICRQLAIKGMHVVLTARDPYAGKYASAVLQKEVGAGAGGVKFQQLDVTDSESVDRSVFFLNTVL